MRSKTIWSIIHQHNQFTVVLAHLKFTLVYRINVLKTHINRGNPEGWKDSISLSSRKEYCEASKEFLHMNNNIMKRSDIFRQLTLTFSSIISIPSPSIFWLLIPRRTPVALVVRNSNSIRRSNPTLKPPTVIWRLKKKCRLEFRDY